MEPMTSPIINPGASPASKKMAIVWIIVALLVLAAVVWYYFIYYIPLPSLPSGPDEVTVKLEQQSTSDELSAIDQDLEVTELGNLDQELGDIDALLAP